VNLSWIVNISTGQCVDIYFASPDSTMTATYTAPWVVPVDSYDRPAISSVVASVKLIRF
jgi:hypothetical protein